MCDDQKSIQNWLHEESKVFLGAFFCSTVHDFFAALVLNIQYAQFIPRTPSKCQETKLETPYSNSDVWYVITSHRLTIYINLSVLIEATVQKTKILIDFPVVIPQHTDKALDYTVLACSVFLKLLLELLS